VSAHEFLFALELTDTVRFEAMLIDVAHAVFGSVGCAGSARASLTTVLRQALSAGVGRGGRRCDLRFVADAGELQIIVSYAGQPEWRTTLALPNP
jgi:hypothetical protein